MIRDRDKTLSSLNSKVTSLQTQVTELLNQTVQSSLHFDEFGSVSILSRSYNFSPPVSMYNSLETALESDQWNASSLNDKIVRASLEYWEFWSNSSSSGSELLYYVMQPAKDYSPVQVNDTTYRYIWDIVVVQNPSPTAGVTWHPFGLYYVDAATGEIFHTFQSFEE